MTKINLANGETVEFAGLNGNNFIVPDHKEMDVSVFTTDNLASGSIEYTDSDGNVQVYPFENLVFTQQQKQKNGDYYICFHKKSDTDVYNDLLETRTSVIEEAITEIYEGVVNGEITSTNAVSKLYADLIAKEVIAVEEIPVTITDEVEEILGSYEEISDDNRFGGTIERNTLI